MTPPIMGYVGGPGLFFLNNVWDVPLTFWVTPQQISDLMYYQSDPNPELLANQSRALMDPWNPTLQAQVQARMDRVKARGMLLQMNVWGAHTGDLEEYRIALALGHTTFRLWTAKELRRHGLNVWLARCLNALPLPLRGLGR